MDMNFNIRAFLVLGGTDGITRESRDLTAGAQARKPIHEGNRSGENIGSGGHP